MTDATNHKLRMNARVLGDPSCPAVLLLHGWGGSILSMAGLQDRLASAYWVHALDLPGFGATPPPPIPWGVSDYAACVLNYLDSAGIARTHLIGHSFGGRISLVLGADQPGRVNKIVLTSAAGIRPPPDRALQIRRELYQLVKKGLGALRLKALQARLQSWYWNRYASDDYKNAGPLKQTFVKVVQEDLAPCAARISASTLLIWGDQDQDTPLWQAQTLEKLIPDAGLVIFKGAGHFAFQQRLPDFVRIVETFFAGS